MAFTDEQIDYIYAKTSGYCEYCEKKISRKNYGKPGEMGAWEVDHSNPVSKGGSDHMNNLFPACVNCNQEKGDMLGSSFRRRKAQENGITSRSSSTDCFIATAAYGSPYTNEVEYLRRWRDRRLIPSHLGRLLVRLYYRVSPVIARYVERSERPRRIIKKGLDTLVKRR